MEQLAIAGDFDPDSKSPRRASAKKKSKQSITLADSDPIARVVVDINAAQLDRTFDFSVPQALADKAVPGSRVRVRFAGRLLNGYLTARQSQTTHEGRLAKIERVLGPAVLTAEIAELARLVADRYAGTLNEVLRDAVPPRHVGAESTFVDAAGLLLSQESDPWSPSQEGEHLDWSLYTNGTKILAELAARQCIRTALVASVSDSGPEAVGDLVAAAGQHAIVVVPDGTDVRRFAGVLERRFGSSVTTLTGDQKPRERYGSFLKIRTGAATCVVGTRNCVFAPVVDLRLIVVWDDGDESLAESRAPGWHAREVAALRSLSSGVSLVIAGHSQSVEAAKLVEQGWLQAITPDQASRHRGPRVVTASSARVGDPAAAARIPRFAWETISQGLDRGPVLIQVGRRGYLPSVACEHCRAVAVCESCAGPLGRPRVADGLTCLWCAREHPAFTCATCDGSKWRAVRVGSSRTAEELRSAFPTVPVVVSDSLSGVLDTVGSEPAIIVATVGAEPLTLDGYAAAVLLDGDAQAGHTNLRSGEQLVRRWFNATAMVRPASGGGVVAVTADPTLRALQALVRGDATGWAHRELLERQETGLPPVTRSAVITGAFAAVQSFVAACDLDPRWRILGPSATTINGSTEEASRVIVLVPTVAGASLAAKLKSALVSGADVVDGQRVTIRVDPVSAL